MASTGNKVTLVDRASSSDTKTLGGSLTKTTTQDLLGLSLTPDKTKPVFATEQVLRAPSGSTGSAGRSTNVNGGSLRGSTGSTGSTYTRTTTPIYIERETPRHSTISIVRDFDRDRDRDFLKGFNQISFSRDRNVRGTSRDDYATGSRRDDIFAGRDGDDAIFGLDGDDTLFGNADEDTIDGGEGKDWLLGGRDDDRLDGKEGDDTIAGNRGDDILIGDNDNDLLFGGRDDDTLYGGKGRDILTGDRGRDLLNGGLEADAFVLRDTVAAADRPEEADLIADFTPSEGDRVYILVGEGFNPADLALIEATASFGTIEVDGRDTPIARSAVNILHAPTNRYLGVVTSSVEEIGVAEVSANLSIVTSFNNIPR
ncbi:MAG: calcium-binding protein [Geitlerinemataceae cyanobacterium]